MSSRHPAVNLAAFSTLIVALASAGALVSMSAEEALAPTLQKAGAYAAQFRAQLAGLVAEERYVQNVRNSMGVNITVDGRGTEPVKHRELRSDILMVRADDRYVEFRDVFEVDGKPVRDRQDRLSKLFLAGGASAGTQLVRIAEESARYNIGSVYRNINTPTLALVFLEPEQQGRSKFRVVDRSLPALGDSPSDLATPPFELPADVQVIEFQEVRKGTLIRRQAGNGDIPARGRFWIEPGTGRVLFSELTVGDPLIRATISVRYTGSTLVGNTMIPAEMRERYVNSRDRATTTGAAAYGRLRRFGVDTQEDIPEVSDKKADAP